MGYLEKRCKNAGYVTENIGYTTFGKNVETISDKLLTKKILKYKKEGYEKIHFVTHSMGALIVRFFLQDHEIPEGSRIVMLSPPNQGTEIADSLKNDFFYKLLAGKVGKELCTDSELILKLKNINYEVGIITGAKSYNLISSKMIPGRDDGRVSTERAKLSEMKDFLIVSKSHFTIKFDKYVADQVLLFLKFGCFNRKI